MSKYEIELKFAVVDFVRLREKLADLGAVRLQVQQHRDTYFNHPCRDFAQTHEALRLRRVDEVPMITYKGAKLASPVKTRIELEWELGAGDSDGSNTERLLTHLGFRRVAEVCKTRESFALIQHHNGRAVELTVTLDDVQQIGKFSEIECIAEQDEMSQAQSSVQTLAAELGLENPESRSYLRLLLQSQVEN